MIKATHQETKVTGSTDPALIPLDQDVLKRDPASADPVFTAHGPGTVAPEAPCHIEPVLPGGAKDVRFGIIGTGAIAEVHARAIAMSAHARLTAVYGKDPSRTRAFAERHHCLAAPSLNALFAEVDAVTIATPSGAHLEPVLAAAAAGKHVLCEKPMEVTGERVTAMIQACDRAGVQLGAVFQSRTSPAVTSLRHAMEKGRFGTPVLVSASVRWYRAPSYYEESPWRGTWSMDGGGAVMNQAIHTLDLMLLFGGEVAEVTAHTGRRLHPGLEVEDTAAALVRFKSGALGVVEASTACGPGTPRRLELSGTGGTATLESDRITRWSFMEPWPGDEWMAGGQFGPLVTQGGAGDPKAISDDGHRRQIEDLARAVRTRQTVALSGREGRKVIDFIEALYASAKSGKTIRLSERT